MKQYIKIVREFNNWKREGWWLPKENSAKQIGEALDEVIKAAERYELVRTLNPREFKQLYAENIAGYGSFDELVDRLIDARNR